MRAPSASKRTLNATSGGTYDVRVTSGASECGTADRIELAGLELREARAARDVARVRAVAVLQDLRDAGELNIAEAARLLGVSRPTTYAMLCDEGARPTQVPQRRRRASRSERLPLWPRYGRTSSPPPKALPARFGVDRTMHGGSVDRRVLVRRLSRTLSAVVDDLR